MRLPFRFESEIEIVNVLQPKFDFAGEYFFWEKPFELPTVSINGIFWTWSFTTLNNISFYTFFPDEGQCAEGTYTLKILDYRRFFTPNGDGNNDYWSLAFANHSQSIDLINIYIQIWQAVGIFIS